MKAIRDIGIPLANKSRRRLEEKRAAYKHGWSPGFIATKAKLDFLLEVRRALRRKDLCEDAILERIREAAENWGKWSNGICMRQRSRAYCLEETMGSGFGGQSRFFRPLVVT